MLRPTSSHGPCLGVLNRHLGRGFSIPRTLIPVTWPVTWPAHGDSLLFGPGGGRKSLDERRVCERPRAEPVVSTGLLRAPLPGPRTAHSFSK